MLQRQKAGIEIAKRAGKYKGRRPKALNNFDEVYGLWKSGEVTAVEACKTLGISRSSFYQRVKVHEGLKAHEI